MSYCTYYEWKVNGRQVMKGEKSHLRRNDGIALFSEDQTKEQESKEYPVYSHGDPPWREYNDVDYDDPMSFDPWMFD